MSERKHLSRREFLTMGGAGAVLAGRAPALLRRVAQEPDQPPNVVVVLADQMRFCDMGCAGNTYVRTPALDRLATQGMRLTNAFACTPLCSPCRAQMLTGRYGSLTGVVANNIKLPETETTIAEVLKARGYATGYVGKWHLEGGYFAAKGDPRRDGYVPIGAARQGFDYWAAHEVNHDYFNAWYYRDTPAPIPIKGYEPTAQTDLAIAFMQQTRERPFLLVVSYGPPHKPYRPPAEYDLYDPAKVALRPNVPAANATVARRDLAQYYGLISSVDHEIGRLMDAIERLGVAGRTVVYFTSDHGDMHYSQGQLLKQRPWEESIHVPSILRFPGRVKVGSARDALLGSVDVMPTLLGMCGVAPPAGVQGIDLSPVILGRTDKEPEALLLANYAAGGVGGALLPWRAVRTRDWLFAAKGDGARQDWLLYDLARDPFEMRNLVSDARHSATRARLRALLVRMRRETQDSAAMDAGLAKRGARRAPLGERVRH